MALRDCPECGNSVSDKAPNCPDCGYPINENNLNQSGEPGCCGCFVVLVFFLIILSML